MKAEWVVDIVFDLKKKTVTFSLKMAACQGRSLVKMVGLKKEAEPDGTLVLPNRKRAKVPPQTKALLTVQCGRPQIVCMLL